MKVYRIKPTGGYCGGLMLINANDENEAWECARKEDDMLDYEGRDRFVVDEIIGLTYSLNEPCVITQALYFE